MNKKGDIVIKIYFIIGFVFILSLTIIFLFSQISITGMASYETGESQIEVTAASFTTMIIFLAIAVSFLLLAFKRAKSQKKITKKKK